MKPTRTDRMHDTPRRPAGPAVCLPELPATRRRLLLGAGGLGLLGATGLSAQAQTAARPAAAGGRRIVVGQSAPQTGVAAEIGLAYFNGAKLFFDAYNEKAGAGGVRIDFRSIDDGYDPARATVNARKLLADGADVLFGFVGTAASDAGAAVAREAGVLFFAPYAASDTLRDTLASAYHVRPSMSDEATKIVRYSATLGQDRMAFMAEDDAMGRAAQAAVVQALKDNNRPALVAQAFVPVNSDKVDAAVTALMKAPPQVVVMASLFNSTAAFIRKMRKAGYGGQFISFSVVGIDPLFTALGKEIAGVVISQVVPSPRTPSTPIVREYLEVINNTDQTPTYESLEGFVAAKAFVEGVKRAQGNKAGLGQAFASMGNYDVGGHRINLRAARGEAVRAIDLVTITADGKVVR